MLPQRECFPVSDENPTDEMDLTGRTAWSAGTLEISIFGDTPNLIWQGPVQIAQLWRWLCLEQEVGLETSWGLLPLKPVSASIKEQLPHSELQMSTRTKRRWPGPRGRWRDDSSLGRWGRAVLSGMHAEHRWFPEMDLSDSRVCNGSPPSSSSPVT